MENASKALIISGAVLIAIILVSMGIYIISSQKATISQSKDSAETVAISQYNSKFLKYKGNRKGSEIIQLVNEANLHNKRNSTDPNRQVTIDLPVDVDSINPYGNYKILNGNIQYNSEGYVNYIQVTQ